LEADIRFYLDENVQVVVADQLRLRGIEVVTARDLGTLSDSDLNHLTRATQMGCVLCTHDEDYLKLAATGIEHAGIVKGVQVKHGVSDWVQGLVLICSVYTPEDMRNHVEYL
jgi:hypothetical protein